MFTFDGTMSHLSTMLYLGATPGSVAPTRIAQPQPGLISIGFSSLGLELLLPVVHVGAFHDTCKCPRPAWLPEGAV